MKKLLCTLLAVLLLTACLPALAAGVPDALRMDVRYVCTSCSVFGQEESMELLEGEQSLLFRADGICEFAIGGPAVKTFYRVRADGVYVVSFYGVEFECVPTPDGIKMDFYGLTLVYTADTSPTAR